MLCGVRHAESAYTKIEYGGESRSWLLKAVDQQNNGEASPPWNVGAENEMERDVVSNYADSGLFFHANNCCSSMRYC